MIHELVPDGWASLWLAGIVALEGLHRLPPGSLLLTSGPAGRWRIHDPPPRRWCWSWASPFQGLVVLHSTGASSGAGVDWRVIRQWLPALRLPGLVAWVVLVFGVPLAVVRWGVAGLLTALWLCLEVDVAVALGACLLLDRAGVPRQRTRRTALPLLSPFAAPRAVEVVVACAAAGSEVLDVLRALVEPATLARFIRPRAYDALIHATSDDTLLWHMTPAELQALVDAPPGGAGPVSRPWCRRCGGIFQPHITACADCGDLPLAVAP